MVIGSFRGHRQMQGDAVTLLQTAEIAQQRGELVHPHPQLLVGNVLDKFGFRLGDEVDGGLLRCLAKCRSTQL